MTASRSVITQCHPERSSRSVIHNVVIRNGHHNVLCHHLRCHRLRRHPLRGHRNCVASSHRVIRSAVITTCCVITSGVIRSAVIATALRHPSKKVLSLKHVQLLIPKEPSPHRPNPLRFHLHAWTAVFHWRSVFVLWK